MGGFDSHTPPPPQMLPPFVESQLLALKEAEASTVWATRPKSEVATLLIEVADLFCEYGEAFSVETAIQMGVTPAEVWLETVFPSIWGLLSTATLIQAASSNGLSSAKGGGERRADWSDQPDIGDQVPTGTWALQILPQNRLEALLLPQFRGYGIIDNGAEPGQRCSHPVVSFQNPAFIRNPTLALCLLPFNLTSIGVLDIVHLLCVRGLRVVAKISEKAEFVGPYLEKILVPLVRSKALALVHGGPELGAQLAARHEFSHVHLTGSAGTAAKLEQIVGREKLSCELGGVTPAIILPDAISTSAGIHHTARQVAFGALANNGQHCVSYQIVLVPDSLREDFERVLWMEMQAAGGRGGGNGFRTLIDSNAAHRLEGLLENARAKGARLSPIDPRSRGRTFPVSLVSGINERMRLFQEEAFGPVVGIMGLPDREFVQHALRVSNSPELPGDLAASLFTSRHESLQTRKMVRTLRHGIVTVNTYPGVVFATSLPWGAGPQGLSGRGWVHHYQILPAARLRKVVLTAPLGNKGFGPLRWEDPWLLDAYGTHTLDFARALTQLTSAYFNRRYLRLFVAQLRLTSALVRREILRRQQERRRIH